MNCSLFNGIRPQLLHDITVDEALDRIRRGTSVNIVTKLRETGNQDLKRDLYAVTFAGTFSYRKADKLIKSTGLLTIDIDHVADPVFIKRYLFNNYAHCFAAWISPSGDGVKAIFRIPEVANDLQYKAYYNSIVQQIDIADPDPANKDISRLCFESFDQEILVRDWEETTVWTDTIEEAPIKTPQVSITETPTIDLTDLLSKAERMLLNCPDGQKHYTLLKASRLLGGYVGSGLIEEVVAGDFLEEVISRRNINSLEGARRTIRDGIRFGIQQPIYIDLTKPYEAKKDVTRFPVDIFPPLYQTIVSKLNTSLNYPEDFTAFSILWLWASIMGRRFVVEVKPGYRTYPVLWFAIIGEPGTVKSHPINTIKEPLDEINSENYKRWKQELKDWERIENNHDPKPVWEKYLISDFTIEALERILSACPNGVGLYTDELSAWIDNANKYSTGQSNSLSKWLSLYDSGRIMIDRKTQDPTMIEKACIPIIGTSQPSVIIDYFKHMSGNGFFDRFLFAFPTVKMQCLPENSSPISELALHSGYVKSFIKNIKQIGEEAIFELETFESYQIINKYLVDISDNEHTNERLRNYIPKLISAIPRIAIIIETINCVIVNESTPVQVSVKSMEKTFDLIKYLLNQADRILIDFNKMDDMEAVIQKHKYATKQVHCFELKEAGFSLQDISKKLNIAPLTAKKNITREQQKRKK